MNQEVAAMSGGHKNDKPGKGGEPLGSNSEIGRKLKQYYDGLISEDIPDRFADLLRQLEEREGDDTLRNGV